MSDVSNYQPVLANFDSAGNLLQMWGPNGKVAFDPSNVAITGGVIGGSPVSAMAPIVSGSVRSAVPAVTAVAATNLCFVFRTADYSVVQCDNPSVRLWNGYCLGDGSHGVAAEKTTGFPLTIRAAILTGGPGTPAANQVGATVWPLTFYNCLRDPEFLAKAGTVSADGLTVTIPDGMWVDSDPTPGLRLAPLVRYYLQTEEVYQTNQLRITGSSGSGTTLGDYRWFQATNTGSPVYATDWSVSSGGATPTAASGSTKFPLAVLGTGDGSSRAKLVAVDGDSIFNEGANNYIGQYGERCPLKTALIAAGYSYISASASGTNIGDMKNFGGWLVRMNLLKNAYAVLTDHGHNDRGTAVGAFANVALPLFQWHNGMLRSYAKPGAKIVRATLAPHTSTSDAWATLANQTYQTAADNPSTGWVGDYLNYLRRTGLYAGIPFSGPQDPDGMWDMVADLGAGADLKWPVTGAANYGTADGTHPSAALSVIAATALQSKLPALIGF